MMQFSRTTTTTKTFTVEWINKNFCTIGPKFRAVRAKSRNKMDACIKCRHKFVDGESMGLACFKEIGNAVICGSCCDELLAQETSEQNEKVHHATNTVSHE